MALAGGKLFSALISLVRNPLPQAAAAGARDWTIVAGGSCTLQQEGCASRRQGCKVQQ